MARPTLAQVQKLQASSLGYLLIRCSQIWGDRAIAAVNAEAGAPVLREAHTRLLPHLQTRDGIRITDLARAVGVSKQATQPLVAELAAQGIVRIEADPQDARAKRVHLTDFGLQALLHGTGILLRIEGEIAPTLGRRGTDALKRHLAALLAILDSPPATSDASQPPPAKPTPRTSAGRTRSPRQS